MTKSSKDYLSAAQKLYGETKEGLNKTKLKDVCKDISDGFDKMTKTLLNFLQEKGGVIKDKVKKEKERASSYIQSKVSREKVNDPSFNSEVESDTISAETMEKYRKDTTSSNDPPRNADEIVNKTNKDSDEEGENTSTLKNILNVLKEGFDLTDGGRKKTMMEKLKDRMQARKDQIAASKQVKQIKKGKKSFFNNPLMWLAGTLLGGIGKIGGVIAGAMQSAIFWGVRKLFGLVPTILGGIGKGLYHLGRFFFKLLPGPLQTILKLPLTIGGMIKDLGVKLISGIGTKLGELGSFIVGGLGKKLGGLMTAIKGTRIGGAVAGFFGKVGAKLGMKTGFKSFLKIAGKNVLKYAGRALAVVTGPLGWAVTIGFLLWDAYDIYKALKKPGGDLPNDIPGDITRARFMSYGFGHKNKDSYHKVIEVEELAGRFFKYNRAKGDVDFIGADDDTLNKIYKTLDYRGENENHDFNVRTWYGERFIPSFKEYLRTYWGVREDLKPGDINKFSEEELAKLVYGWTPPTEVWDVESLPLLDAPMTEVNKGEFDELIISIKSRLKKPKQDLDNKNGNIDQDKRAKENLNSPLYKENEKNADSPTNMNRSTPKARTGAAVVLNHGSIGNQIAETMGKNAMNFGGGLGAGIGTGLNAGISSSLSSDITGVKDYGFQFGEGDMEGFNKNSMGNKFITIDEAINQASKLSGIPADILWTFAKIESSLNRNAGAGTSSASGLFQFIKGTWKSMVEKYGGKYGLSVTNADRFNPLHSALMASEYMKENMGSAKKWMSEGLDMGTALYLAHFLGNGGSSKLFSNYKTNPNMPMEQAVATDQYNANISAMGGLTIAQFINRYKEKFYNHLNTPAEKYGKYKEEREKFKQAYDGIPMPKTIDVAPTERDMYKGDGSVGPSGVTNSVISKGDSAEDIYNKMFGVREQGVGRTSTGFSTYDGAGQNGTFQHDSAKTDYPVGNMTSVDISDAGIKDIGQITGIAGQDQDGNKESAIVVHPIAPGYTYYFTSFFGERNTGIPGASKDHKGVDIGGPASDRGIPILATGSGKVIHAAKNEMTGNLGYVVYVQHPNGYQTRYAHLKRGSIQVSVGQEITAGTVIGIMGNSAESLNVGIHLHFEIRKGVGVANSNSVAEDPFNWKVIKESCLGHRVPNKNNPNGLPEKTSNGEVGANNTIADNPELSNFQGDPTSQNPQDNPALIPGGISGSFGVMDAAQDGSGGIFDQNASNNPKLAAMFEEAKNQQQNGVSGASEPINVQAEVDNSKLEGKTDETNAILKEMVGLMSQLVKSSPVGSVATATGKSTEKTVLNNKNNPTNGMDFTKSFFNKK